MIKNPRRMNPDLKLITDMGVYDSKECLGVPEGEHYVQIIHHVDLFEHRVFNQLCDEANTYSTYCLDKKTKMYETQCCGDTLLPIILALIFHLASGWD